jgi:hypothetical protein
MMLLQGCGKIDGRVAIYLGDGGVDAYKGDFTKNGKLIVYQSKYFSKPWGESQKRQIRASFETAANSKDFNLKEWFLCVPVRLTRQDLAWFHEWKAEQSVPIDIIDGDDLTQLLDGANGARTRQKFRDWGVFSVRNGFPVIQARVRSVKKTRGPARPSDFLSDWKIEAIELPKTLKSGSDILKRSVSAAYMIRCSGMISGLVY